MLIVFKWEISKKRSIFKILFLSFFQQIYLLNYVSWLIDPKVRESPFPKFSKKESFIFGFEEKYLGRVYLQTQLISYAL